MAGRGDVQFVVGQLRKAAQQELGKQGLDGRKARGFVPREEQLQRFLAGAERWRVEQGLVSPAQYAEYERAMLRRLGAVE